MMSGLDLIIEEIRSILFPNLECDYLAHYGMPRRSGRYPWGSGEDPYQHGQDFLSRVEELRKQKYTYTDKDTGKTYSGDTAIAKALGLTTTQFRTEISIATSERRLYNVNTAKRLRDKEGLSNSEIARKMGVNESTVRYWFNEKAEARMNAARNTADFLKKQVDEKKMIDVGAGTEFDLNVSRKKMDDAIYLLQREGYELYTGGVPQPTNKGQQTIQHVLCAPGTPYKDIYDYSKVKTISEYISHDGGDTFSTYHYPESMDSKRIKIRYADDGGDQRDGVIQIRRGVPDLDLGNNHYAQCRILVDGSHYLKGMAVYGDDKDFPPGVDIIFNTNKKSTTPKMDVLKPIKADVR